MEFVQRSYSGHLFRPRPLVEEDPALQLWIVATCWGAPEAGQKVVEIVKEQLALSQDSESTRVGTFVQGLTDEGNRMRAAALFANDYLCTKENSREYTTAVELALISIQKNVLSWVQIGNPHLLLSSESGIEPLCYSPDWSWQLRQNGPLMAKGLGLKRSCNLNCGSYRLQGSKKEKLIMVGRSSIPGDLYTLKKADLKTCSESLVQDDSESPFWLGVLSF